MITINPSLSKSPSNSISLSPASKVSTGLDNKELVVLNGMVSNFVKEGPTLTPTVSKSLNVTFDILFVFP